MPKGGWENKKSVILLGGILSAIVLLLTGLTCVILMYRENKIKFQTLANMDALTNIYNRYGFDTLAERMIAKNPRNHYIAALLDVDDFKLINDVYGHTYGDRALTFLYKGEEHSFYISLGYAEYPQSGSNHSQLIRCADAATQRKFLGRQPFF